MRQKLSFLPKRQNVTDTGVMLDANARAQKGQSIVIIAFALIGILAFVGIAVDVGFVFARSTQLQSAVDSAALAGVVELISDTNDAGPANRKAEQFFNTNGFDLRVRAPSQPDNGEEAIGRPLPPSALGALEYELTVNWPVDLFFLKLIGRDTITLTRHAIAGIFPQADVYASRRIEDGILSTSNQAVFGPWSCSNMGDPFSPDASPWDDGLYTYQYRILIPPDYPHDVVRVELFDPDSMNQANNTHDVIRTELAQDNGLSFSEQRTCGVNPGGSNGQRQQPCLLRTGEETVPNVTLDDINPFWFVRIDENRYGTSGNNNSGSCGMPGSYQANMNTQTKYELYYWAQNPDGTLVRVSLATYTGQVGDGVRDDGGHLTDMQWVSPGAPPSFGQPNPTIPADCPGNTTNFGYDCNHDGVLELDPDGTSGFEVSIPNDLVNILTDPATQNRFIYMDVTAISGATENGFEIWAGPNTYVNDINSDANVRNLQILNNRGAHSSQGITVFGLGRLPLNSNTDQRVPIPLVWVGPEKAGQSIYISLFDSDSGAQPPIHFYFDSIAFDDWHVSPGTEGGRCAIGYCNNQWINPAFEIIVPGDTENCDYNNPDASCIPFYGGRLIASYDGGNTDTYGWEVRLSGQPYLIE